MNVRHNSVPVFIQVMKPRLIYFQYLPKQILLRKEIGYKKRPVSKFTGLLTRFISKLIS